MFWGKNVGSEKVSPCLPDRTGAYWPSMLALAPGFRLAVYVCSLYCHAEPSTNLGLVLWRSRGSPGL